MTNKKVSPSYPDNLWNHLAWLETFRRGRDDFHLNPGDFETLPVFGCHCTRCGHSIGAESNWTCIPCHGMVEVACNVRINNDKYGDGYRKCKLHDGELYEEDKWWERMGRSKHRTTKQGGWSE